MRSRLFWLVSSAFLAACVGRTEIVIGVATDLQAKGQIDQVELIASRDGTPIIDQQWMLVDQPAGQFELPGSFGIYSADGSDTRVDLAVKGFKDNNVITERDSTVSLIGGLTLFMRLGIVADCGSLSAPSCAAGETCVEGVCRAQQIDARRLPAFRKELVGSTECDSGTHFIISSTGDPMPALPGGCAPDEYCQEGTCYKLLKGEDGALQQGLWIQQPTPTTYVLRALWGTPDGADIFSVGDHGTILHLSGAGPAGDSGWAMETSNTTEDLYAVYGTSVNDVWAAGADGTFVHRDASGWTVVPQTSTARIDGLYSDFSDDAWAVGRTSPTTPQILHYTGSAFSQVTIPPVTDLRAIWGTSGTDLWAVGEGSNILHGNGTTFTQLTPPPMQDYTSVGGSASGVYIVGRGGVILNSDLKVETTPVTADLFRVWANPSGDVFVVGDYGVILHRENGAWVQQPAKTDQPLFAVWGTKSGDLFAAGRDGVILHNTGTPSQCALDSDCPNVCATALLTTQSCTAGACVAASPAPCPGGVICADAVHCATSCSDDSGCQGGLYCGSGGFCRPQKPQGAYCDDAATGDCKSAACSVCATGFSCTDHVCCDKSPTDCGGCMRCNAPTGTCGPVPFAQDPHGACTANVAECQDTSCNGEGGCGNYGNACGAIACDGSSTGIDASTCVDGACMSTDFPCPSPGCGAGPPVACISGGTTTCANDNGCGAPTNTNVYCDGNGICVPRLPKGSACDPTSTKHCKNPATCAECAAGLACVDGFCCDAACAGQCQACDVVGKLGTCTTVSSGPPHGSRAACGGSGACSGFCDGSSPTACGPATGQCAPPTCDGSNNYTLNAAASCAAGACAKPASQSCAPFACVDNACLTACATSSDCASTTPTCDLRTHTCK